MSELQVFKFSDYREILTEEFKLRSIRNSNYTLNAFSRDLGISSSRLSEVFHKKCGISFERARKLAEKLKYNEIETEYFCHLANLAHARSLSAKQMSLEYIEELHETVQFRRLSSEVFDGISDWYYFAILELTYLKDFQSNHEWIAQRLGLDIDKVKDAVDKLLQIGFLATINGKWRDQKEYVINYGEYSSAAIRKFHTQILQKVIHNMGLSEVEERENSTMVMAIKKEKITQAKLAIQRFRENFCTEIGGETSLDKDSVYALNINFISLEDI